MSKSDLKKVYTTLPVDLVFQNTKSNKGNFDYRFDFHYHHFSGDPNPFFLLKEQEDFFDFNVDLHKEIAKIHSANLLFRVQSEHSKLTTLSDFHAIHYFLCALLPARTQTGKSNGRR
jgi:hypothetical protein